MIALGAAFFMKRKLAPPSGWSEFKAQQQAKPTARPTPETIHV
jgi:hypothetical protein